MGKGLEYLRRNALGAIALFVALGGTSYAASGGFSSSGTLKACANEEGVIRLLKPGKSCKKGQKAVSWNQTGPAGAKGLTGATGASGAGGATGATGGQGSSAVNLWARIGTGGALEAGNGVTSVTPQVSGTEIEVTFNRDVHGCGAVATLDRGPADRIYASPSGGGTVLVAMLDNNGLNLGGFTVAVTC